MQLTQGIWIRGAVNITAQLSLSCKFVFREKGHCWNCQSMKLWQGKQSSWNKSQESFLHQQCKCTHSEHRQVRVWAQKSILHPKWGPHTLEPECFSSPKPQLGPSTWKCSLLLSSCSKPFKIQMCLKVCLGTWGWKCMCMKNYSTAHIRFLYVLIKRR